MAQELERRELQMMKGITQSAPDNFSDWKRNRLCSNIADGEPMRDKALSLTNALNFNSHRVNRLFQARESLRDFSIYTRIETLSSPNQTARKSDREREDRAQHEHHPKHGKNFFRWIIARRCTWWLHGRSGHACRTSNVGIGDFNVCGDFRDLLVDLPDADFEPRSVGASNVLLPQSPADRAALFLEGRKLPGELSALRHERLIDAR